MYDFPQKEHFTLEALFGLRAMSALCFQALPIYTVGQSSGNTKLLPTMIPERDQDAVNSLDALPPHQTIPEVHLPAAFGLRRGDGGGEVVELSAAVLRVFGGDHETRAAEGDEVLQRGVETLADVSGQNGGGAPLAIGEDLEEATTGGIAQRGIDGIRRDDLRRRRGDRGRRGGRAHASFCPIRRLLTSVQTPQARQPRLRTRREAP